MALSNKLSFTTLLKNMFASKENEGDKIHYSPTQIPFEPMLLALWNELPNQALYTTLLHQPFDLPQFNPASLTSSTRYYLLPLLVNSSDYKAALANLNKAPVNLSLLVEMVMVYIAFYAHFNLQVRDAIEHKMQLLFDNYLSTEVVRELADLLYQFFGQDEFINREKQEYFIKLLLRITRNYHSHHQHLIGSTLVHYADWLHTNNQQLEADKIYSKAIVDLADLVDRIDDTSLPNSEKLMALWWLKEAYYRRYDLISHKPDDLKAAKHIERLLKIRGMSTLDLDIRIGVIASSYYDEQTKLTAILKDILQFPKNDTELLTRALIHKYGLSSTEVSFYLSAIGSYSAREVISPVVKMVYDEAHQQVFEALDNIKSQSTN